MNYVKIKDQDDIIESLPEGNDKFKDLLEEFGYLHVYQIEERLGRDVSILEKYAHKASLSDRILIAISNNCNFIDSKITRLYYIVKTTSKSVRVNNLRLCLNYYSSFFHNEKILSPIYSYVDKVLRYQTTRDIICEDVSKDTIDEAMIILPHLKYFVRKSSMYIRANDLRNYLLYNDY